VNGFHVDGGLYSVPLVYSVCDLGNWVSADGGGDADPLGVPLFVELPVHALTVASASTATAAAPTLTARHRRLVMPLFGFTCAYLLSSKPPGNARVERAAPPLGAASGRWPIRV